MMLQAVTVDPIDKAESLARFQVLQPKAPSQCGTLRCSLRRAAGLVLF